MKKFVYLDEENFDVEKETLENLSNNKGEEE